MKRVFGYVEAVFDILYLITAAVIGLIMLFTSSGNTVRLLAGIMALVLAGGDAFHLLPRVAAIFSEDEEKFRNALGRGKQITSVTMTGFYLFAWYIGVILFAPESAFVWTVAVWVLAAVRVVLCFFPQNKWTDRYPPVSWGIARNIPFFAIGLIVAGLYFISDASGLMWLAILFSFGFYLPVVLWANKNPKIGILMLPKTCAYVWMLILCMTL